MAAGTLARALGRASCESRLSPLIGHSIGECCGTRGTASTEKRRSYAGGVRAGLGLGDASIVALERSATWIDALASASVSGVATRRWNDGPVT